MGREGAEPVGIVADTAMGQVATGGNVGLAGCRPRLAYAGDERRGTDNGRSLRTDYARLLQACRETQSVLARGTTDFGCRHEHRETISEGARLQGFSEGFRPLASVRKPHPPCVA